MGRCRHCRTENSKHIGEEEHEALPDFRKSASDTVREALAIDWLNWRYKHDRGTGVDTKDKDPETYIEQIAHR